ncbi:DarT ssDNA thymidine ADP-ribosyltransferase family protein [Paenibacillus sp. GCM10012307]|uniref:DUF4433 domain-containing protein n=1 Tax=Paenibacillus roseus TaxID=2798579 RepID=A0A934MLR4_9BACL|nr:DarT ssDNA thymidine ADP-ribosyltransferase family protein [Paenibacillus roseus]MBJ6362485.1 DUF4433 domain-containing protein [Paenibacillus roseus]
MKEVVNEYGIEYLVHFTQAKNLKSIFKHGLLSVDELDGKELSYEFNDSHRLDGHTDAICLSIEFPNYKMFYKYRNQDRNVDWVVLGVEKKVLWKKKCAFCVENAASANITAQSVQSRMGKKAFTRMYDEYPDKPLRKVLDIPKTYPTNPQAEILVFNNIEVDYIWGVAFEKPSIKKRYEHLIPKNVKSKVVEHLFRGRNDFKYWR